MATYYVRPDGSNSNAGTGYLASQAWLTPAYAASTMVSGDVCYVAPGFYGGVSAGVVFANNNTDLIGDPSCTYFLDMSPGEVIIAQRNSLHGTTLYSAAAITLSSRNSNDISKITIEAGSGVAIQGSSGSYQIDFWLCKIYGDISGFTNTTTTSVYWYDCWFYRTSMTTSYMFIFVGCYFANLQYAGGSAVNNMQFVACIVNLSTVTLSSSTTTTNNVFGFYACRITCASGGTSAAGYSITAPASAVAEVDVINCIVEAGGKFIDFHSNSNACKLYAWSSQIKNLVQFFKKGTCTGTTQINNCWFEGCIRCVEATNASYPITVNAGIVDKCVTYGSANVTFSGTYINYGGNTGGATLSGCYSTLPSELVKVGQYPTTTYYMTGETTSLLVRTEHGNYLPVYYAWIDCEAGVQTTVTFKYKSTTNSGTMYAYLGTASYTNTVTVSMQEYTATLQYTHYATEKVLLTIYPQQSSSYGFVYGNINVT